MTAVAALGNRYRGDDGVGPRVVELLGAGTCLGDDLTGLLDLFEQADEVILVDAVRAELPVGSVVTRDLLSPGATGSELARLSSHSLNLEQVLELARSLERLPARLTLVGVVGRNFGPGESLSPEVEAAALRLVESILPRQPPDSSL